MLSASEIIAYSPAAHGGRPLPMGRVYCPKCMIYIYGEVHLASRYRAMLRPGSFSKFGFFPVAMTTSQHWGKSFQRKPLFVLQHLARCQTLLADFQKYPVWPSLVLTDNVLNHWDHRWPRSGLFSCIFDLDLWPLTSIYNKNHSLLLRLITMSHYGGHRSNDST